MSAQGWTQPLGQPPLLLSYRVPHWAQNTITGAGSPGAEGCEEVSASSGPSTGSAGAVYAPTPTGSISAAGGAGCAGASTSGGAASGFGDGTSAPASPAGAVGPV